MTGDSEEYIIGGGLADGDGVRGSSDSGGLSRASAGDDFSMGTTVRNRFVGASNCDEDDDDDRKVRPSLL